ncbi:hypothetical protein GCM10010417_48550 [Streptomyces carpaticus]
MPKLRHKLSNKQSTAEQITTELEGELNPPEGWPGPDDWDELPDASSAEVEALAAVSTWQPAKGASTPADARRAPRTGLPLSRR